MDDILDKWPVVNDVEMCPNCKAFHTDNNTGRWIADQCLRFNPENICVVCAKPVIGLSFSGPDVCPACDAGIYEK